MKFVDAPKAEPTTPKIFLDSTYVEGRTTWETIEKDILEILKKLGISISACHSQAYDSVSNMKEIAAVIKESNPSQFIHTAKITA